MKNKFFIYLLSLFSVLFFMDSVSAHCPLCTIGVGAAAAGAVWLGVSKVAVALLIGGFAMSMSMWFARIIKKRYIPYQKSAIIIGIFLLTVLPIMPIFTKHTGFHISLMGGYGTWLNRTYLINLSLLSSFFGGLLVYIAPNFSKKITKLRGDRMIPFQGIILTVSLLLIAATVIHFLI